MESACSTDVDGANCGQITQHREYGWPVHVSIGVAGIVVLFSRFLEVPEDNMEDEGEESPGRCHRPPEDLRLRVVAGGVGDGGMWEWRLLLILDCHVVGVGRSEENDWEVEINNVVDPHATDGLGIGLSRQALRWIIYYHDVIYISNNAIANKSTSLS